MLKNLQPFGATLLAAQDWQDPWSEHMWTKAHDVEKVKKSCTTYNWQYLLKKSW